MAESPEITSDDVGVRHRRRGLFSRITRLDWLVFLTLFVAMGYFGHSNPGWNANSRMALAVAWAKTGRPEVEKFIRQHDLETMDLAVYNGHQYSDKSIGTSILGIPAVLIEQAIETAMGKPLSFRWRAYLITLMSVVPCGALAGVLLMRWLAMIWPRQRASLRACAFLSLAVMMGTLLFTYSSLFMSYAPATMFLLGCLIMAEKTIAVANDPKSRRAVWLAFWAGLLGGLTILCEYLYAAAVGLTGLYLIFSCPRAVAGRACLTYGAGCLLGNMPFLVYSILIFGRPSIPYEHHMVSAFRHAMSEGLMGATWPPKPEVILLTTIHPYRGLFFYSPVLVLGLAGVAGIIARRSAARPLLGWLCLTCVTFYILFNGCYYMWWGGWSFSPRHLAPAIPFLAAGLGMWASKLWSRWTAGVLGAVGVVVHLLVNATEPQIPDGGWQWALLRPNLQAYDYLSVFMRQTWPKVKEANFDINLGTLPGLSGWWSLVPLMIFLTAMAWLIGRKNWTGQTEDAPEAERPAAV